MTKARLTRLDRILALVPGVSLSAAISLIALGIQALEERIFGHPYLEGLVIAIILGMIIRSIWEPSEAWRSGIAFSAKHLLELAVALLGASISFAAIAAFGPTLLAATALTVVFSLAAAYGISRLLGLSEKLSILIACGNSICGNSAIASVAPVIGASSDEIASSIAFTAILGVLVVLGLPLLIPLLALSPYQYGVLAGLTVYAVPQVLAATIPAGLLSTQVGTLVKLLRVLALGPVVLGFALWRHRSSVRSDPMTSRIKTTQMVPWFIIGFLAFASLRSIDLLTPELTQPLLKFATVLTVVSMAALGLGVDIRIIGRVGSRATAAVTLSLLLLTLAGIAVARFLA